MCSDVTKMHSDWIGRGVTFANTHKRSKGIHKTIKCLFAPSFDFKKLVNRPKNPGGLTFKQAKRRGKLIDSQLEHNSKKKLKEVHLLLSKLKELNLTITASQFVVGDEESRLATKIDLI